MIRAVRPDDKERLRAAFGELDRTSIYTRFFGYRKELTETELHQATNVDFDRIVALWANIFRWDRNHHWGGRFKFAIPSRLRGPARRSRLPSRRIITKIASCLLGHLVRIARSKGLVQLDADVLARNRPMLAVFARSGLPMRQQSAQDVIHVTLSLDAEVPFRKTCATAKSWRLVSLARVGLDGADAEVDGQFSFELSVMKLAFPICSN